MNLQKAIITLNRHQLSSDKEKPLIALSDRAFLVATFLFLVFMLSLPVIQIQKVIWFAFFPIVMAPLSGQSYSGVFRKSLVVLPFLILIGIFNPVFDHREAFKVSDIVISCGWISFVSILLRGLLAMQALIILVNSIGFINICNSLRLLGVPSVLTTQLYLLYRYIGVLMEEANSMRLSVISRGYGRKSFPIKLWAQFAGALLLRAYDRAKRIHKAMISRGFEGVIFSGIREKSQPADIWFCCTVIVIFIILRFSDLSLLFFR